MGYVIEVVKFETNMDSAMRNSTKLFHVGYMNKIFTTKKEAIDYYNKHNRHMRRMNEDDLCSDWDPDTCLKYIIRENYGIYSNIVPFDEKVYKE